MVHNSIIDRNRVNPMAIQRFGKRIILRACTYAVMALVLISCESKTDTSSPGWSEETNSNEAEEEKEPSKGEQLFTTNCISCHGIDGKLAVGGAADLSKSTLSDKEIINVLENGRNAMPVMKDILKTKENMDSVAAYLIELRK